MTKRLSYKPRLKKSGRNMKINDYYTSTEKSNAGFYTKSEVYELIRDGFEIDFDYSNVNGKANYYGLHQFKPEMHYFSILETQKLKERFTTDQVKRILCHGGLMSYIRRLEDQCSQLA